MNPISICIPKMNLMEQKTALLLKRDYPQKTKLKRKNFFDQFIINQIHNFKKVTKQKIHNQNKEFWDIVLFMTMPLMGRFVVFSQ